MMFSKPILAALALFMTVDNALGYFDLEGCLEDCEDLSCRRRDLRGSASREKINYRCKQRVINDCKAECRATAATIDAGRKLEAAEVATHECAAKDYVLSVTVKGGHLLLNGEPQCDGSECMECPSLAFHAMNTRVEGETHMEKIVHQYERSESDQSLPLGVFALGDIAKAHQDASVGSDTKYDFVKNNCASVTIDMGRKLGINPMDRKIVKFVARRLKEDSQKNRMLKDLAEKGDGAMEDFVSNYIGERVDARRRLSLSRVRG